MFFLCILRAFFFSSRHLYISLCKLPRGKLKPIITTTNMTKCEFKTFGRSFGYKLCLMGEKIERKLQCRYLGVYVDENLIFIYHITNSSCTSRYVPKNLSKFNGLNYTVRDFYTKKHLVMFYKAFAESVMRYGLLMYGSALKTTSSSIDTAQRRVLRAVNSRKVRIIVSNL